MPERGEPTEVVVVGDDRPLVVHRVGDLGGLAAGSRAGVPDVLAGLRVEREPRKHGHLLLPVSPAVDVRPVPAGVAVREPKEAVVPVDGLVGHALLVEGLTDAGRRGRHLVHADDRRQRPVAGRTERCRVVDERLVPL